MKNTIASLFVLAVAAQSTMASPTSKKTAPDAAAAAAAPINIAEAAKSCFAALNNNKGTIATAGDDVLKLPIIYEKVGLPDIHCTRSTEGRHITCVLAPTHSKFSVSISAFFRLSSAFDEYNSDTYVTVEPTNNSNVPLFDQDYVDDYANKLTLSMINNFESLPARDKSQMKDLLLAGYSLQNICTATPS